MKNTMIRVRLIHYKRKDNGDVEPEIEEEAIMTKEDFAEFIQELIKTKPEGYFTDGEFNYEWTDPDGEYRSVDFLPI